MARGSKVCPEPACPHLAGECPHHQRIPWAGSTRAKQLPRGWQRTRRRILHRDPICTICNKVPSTEVHHLNHPQDHSDHNLRGVCTHCHATESGRQGQQARHP